VFGQVAIPLGPSRCFLVGQVKSVDDFSSLPSIVRRRIPPWERLHARSRHTNPNASYRYCVDIERHDSDCSRILDLGDGSRYAPVLAGGNHIERFVEVQSFDWLGHPEWNVAARHELLQTLDNG